MYCSNCLSVQRWRNCLIQKLTLFYIMENTLVSYPPTTWRVVHEGGWATETSSAMLLWTTIGLLFKGGRIEQIKKRCGDIRYIDSFVLEVFFKLFPNQQVQNPTKNKMVSSYATKSHVWGWVWGPQTVVDENLFCEPCTTKLSIVPHVRLNAK